MEKIDSFKVDHNDHPIGFYLSKQMGDIFTYDLRMKVPNGGDYLSQPALHSIEHLFATAVRNGEKKDSVVYFGPMGCRTGCYLLLKGVGPSEARSLTVATLKICLSMQEVPGAKREECGNYKEHDLAGAKAELAAYLKALEA